MDEEIDPRELERDRRRDHDMAAERKALMRTGQAKIFKQIGDRQARVTRDRDEEPERPKRRGHRQD